MTLAGRDGWSPGVAILVGRRISLLIVMFRLTSEPTIHLLSMNASSRVAYLTLPYLCDHNPTVVSIATDFWSKGGRRQSLRNVETLATVHDSPIALGSCGLCTYW